MKKDLLLFGAILESDIYDDGYGITEDDERLLRVALMKVYGVCESDSAERKEEADAIVFEDMKKLVVETRCKVNIFVNESKQDLAINLNFWNIARELLHESNCRKRRYACVIANDGVIIATGYNQPLAACTTCVRMDVEHNTGSYDDCPAVHAEVSALINAPQELLEGAELYLVCADEPNPIPCPGCAKLLKWAGVKVMKEVEG